MSAKLQGKNVLVITANTGIERDELLEPLKTLKQQGATVTHATIEGGEAQTWVHDSEKDLIVNSDARLQGLRAEDYDLLLVPGAPGQGIQRRRQDGRRHLPRPLAADRRRCRPRQDPDLLFQRAYRPDQRRRGLGRHAGESLPGERLDPDHLAQPG
ncbi:intracellular protease, PfpI family [Pseudomonas aeruginosa]|nr:intracellular protease, PfpI family [Pseudomonas aeruginosa]